VRGYLKGESLAEERDPCTRRGVGAWGAPAGEGAYIKHIYIYIYLKGRQFNNMYPMCGEDVNALFVLYYTPVW
jgi:hypothetical protein